ncbi:MAG TPA: tetratricopeptide repeat protein [Candidatus Acidoferrum sp.]|nr:tetratricopeptide repeat protein [Candidatus Acidoferrum sp.]
MPLTSDDPSGAGTMAALQPATQAPSSPSAAAGRQPGRSRDWLFALFLLAATLLAYLPALPGGFVWDDDAWTTRIPKLTQDGAGLWQMWSKPGALQQYYPLTGTTFWLDHQLWGTWTLPYHVENVVLHACAAMLLWRLLRKLQVPGAWLAGAVFALHPVMVESAGWITERKNVLSLCFFLAALLAYGQFTGLWRGPDQMAEAAGSPSRRRRAYGWALLLFVAALLAKATAFCLPAVILLACWWKRGGILWREDVLPTLPFFAVAVMLGTVTAWVERNTVGAKGPEWAFTLVERCLIAGRALWFYAGKLLWPAHLCFVYPQWRLSPGSFVQWLYPAAAAGALMALWLLRSRIGRGPATAAFYFAGTLFPVLGFMNVYGMRFSFVWDHWVYLSSLGLIALVCALAASAVERFGSPWLLYAVAAVLLPVLGVLTWRQCGMYADLETLWRTTIARNPSCWLAQNMLGFHLAEQGRIDEAIEQYKVGLRVRPDDAGVHNNLGAALLGKGQVDEALGHYREALRLSPNYLEAHCGLAEALEAKGRNDEAALHYREAIRLKPKYFVVHLALARNLSRAGHAREAASQMEEFLRACPSVNLEAQSSQIREPSITALNNLAWLLATSSQAQDRDGVRAVGFAERACELTQYRDTVLVGTLAAAYAEAGRFAEAVTSAEMAVALATQAGDQPLLARNRQLLELYRTGQPCREPSNAAPSQPGPPH